MGGLGASTGAARTAAGMYGSISGIGVLSKEPGTGYTNQWMVRAFPGTQVAIGSPEFFIWAIFGLSFAYLLGVHWLLGSARHVVSG
jgi:hypothetical protein